MDNQLRNECIEVLEGLKENVGNNIEAMGHIQSLISKLKVPEESKSQGKRLEVPVEPSSDRRDVPRDLGETDQHKAEDLHFATKATKKK